MWFTSWLDTSKGSAFADSLAADYDKLRRSVAIRGDDKAKQVRKFEKLAQRVEEFHQENRLNFYQKAKMLSDIKAGLGGFGIDEEEISAFLRSLLLKGIRS